MYCERIMIPELQKVSEAIPKKCAASGCIRLLCECPYLRDPSQKYHCFWAPIMQVIFSHNIDFD